MSQNKIIINVDKLTKKFGDFTALDNLSLKVSEGEVHGFLGPNGSGKSTTIRVVLGLLKKTSGKVQLLGKDPWLATSDIRKNVAYVPGDVNLWPNLTGGEIIDLLAKLRGSFDNDLRNKLCTRFDLDTSKKAHTYSKGNRQKVALIAALASNTPLLVLDEPTAGLDPLMESVFQDCIRQARQQGRTVLLSSHILSQVEVLADRISIIRQGSLVESGTLQELRHLTDTTITVSTKQPLKQTDKRSGIKDVKTLPDGRLQFSVASDDLESAIKYLSGIGVTTLESHPPTLEQLLLRHYDEAVDKKKVRK